jgi:hypothetical protein
MVTSPANNATGVMVCTGHVPIKMAAAPTISNMAYLSATTVGLGTSTVPPVNATDQKLRLGWIEEALLVAAIDYGVVAWQPELLAVLSDGVAD